MYSNRFSNPTKVMFVLKSHSLTHSAPFTAAAPFVSNYSATIARSISFVIHIALCQLVTHFERLMLTVMHVVPCVPLMLIKQLHYVVW
jgi:hypothetical protein